MKKFLCIILCLFMLNGCVKEDIKDVKKEPLSVSGFSAMVNTTINEVNISAKVEYTMNDKITFTLTSPETLKGTVILCSDDEYKLSYEGLSFVIPNSKLPFNMLCKTVETCINNVQGTTPIEGENGNLVYTYQIDEHICQLYTDMEKRFLKLYIDEKETLVFSDFRYV